MLLPSFSSPRAVPDNRNTLNQYLWKKGRSKEGRNGKGKGSEEGKEERKEEVFFQEVAKGPLVAPVIG